MFMLFLVSVLSTSIYNGGRNYSDCKSLDWKPKACWEAKQLDKAAHALCKVQGKDFVGSAPGNHNGCSK